MDALEQLRIKYGSYEAAARAMGLSVRTLATWKTKLQNGVALNPGALALIEKWSGNEDISNQNRG